MTESVAPIVDPNAITTAPDHDEFTLVPVIRDLLRTRYCAPGTIFLVEGIDIIPVSKTGRWQAVRLLLGDGEFCVQGLLSAECQRFAETGEVSTGFYIKVEQFDLELEAMDPEDWAGNVKEGQKMVFLALHDLTTVGWNDSYRAMALAHRGKAEITDADSSPTKGKGKGKEIQRTPQASPPAPAAKAKEEPVAAKLEPASSAYGDDFDMDAMDDAFETMEKIVFPSSKKTSTPKSGPPSRIQAPVALPRDWVDRQAPLKLTTLHAIPSLPYAQNWTCNTLAIIASLSPVEASYLPPYKQRTARLADPSTAKQVHLTVFLDPEAFDPPIGSAVLLTGVKNHRFDGGSLKKYASDANNGRQWWFEDPVDMTWCDVAGIKSWWNQMEGHPNNLRPQIQKLAVVNRLVHLSVRPSAHGCSNLEREAARCCMHTSPSSQPFPCAQNIAQAPRSPVQSGPLPPPPPPPPRQPAAQPQAAHPALIRRADAANKRASPPVLIILPAQSSGNAPYNPTQPTLQRAIDDFLGSLSSWDLLYLRRRMHLHEARIKLASLEDLPAEIVIAISQFLELEDLLTCAAVCRSWHAAWSCGAVTASLCCRHFAGLTERHGLPHADGHRLLAVRSRLYIDKYLRPRPNAYFSSRWFVGGGGSAAAAEDMRERVDHQAECVDFGLDPLQMCYDDGLLAWQPEDGYVVLNDLRAMTRSRCSFGSSLVAGRKMDLQAVTRKLIVFSSIDLHANSEVCREIRIWTAADGEWKRITLPARFAKCYAQGGTVVAVTTTGDAFYWSQGGPTIDLETTTATGLTAPPRECKPSLQNVPGVVFHPNDDGIFYLTWVYQPTRLSSDHRIHVIVVVKFMQGKPVMRYETAVSNPARTCDPQQPYSDGILRFSLRCQRMNSHGLYMLGVVQTCLHYHGSKNTVAESRWDLACFNALTEKFVHRSYDKCLISPKFHRPTWDWAEWHNIQAWDDYLVVLWQPRPHVIHEPCTFTELLLATDSLACVAGSREVFVEGVRQRGLEPALTIDTFHQRRSGVARRVFVDDDFIVYAAPDSVLVSTFKGARGVLLPLPMEGNPMTALAGLPLPRWAETPRAPAPSWDGDVYTTLTEPQLQNQA
ncbi:Cyclin-like F-box [Cordyceps fumosorosea ARSEF 2679]|uniref:Cyclin-like F-box n=1 Tax=Cordyceps fumosorosea (strain ARSEF 2679) TaxID=1081104 RepID=A0A168BBE8_CORFA|nr:Cyclin-like F-box [Cordyceps fumosorosea ARSEF 2679]OAA69886.1 Cyclin-like F-box [Cordyceps fumosorosea ARSEF 2679]